MTAGLNDRDWELLSAYLDSSLSPAETRVVEARLKKEPEFNAAYQSLWRTRTILRAIPDVKRRRNFYVTPQMAGQVKWTWLIPVFNFSSLATGLVAVILMVMNLLPVGMKSAQVQQAIMPGSAMVAATAPVVANSTAQQAAEDAAPAVSKQEVSTQPVAQKEAQTQLDQSAAPALELAAPAPATGAVTGEQPQPLPSTPEEDFVAPAPPAAAPMVESENEPAAVEPEMNAAGGGMLSESTAEKTIAGAPSENDTERQRPAPTMTLEPLMKSAPLDITETPEPTIAMPVAAVHAWTAESPMMTLTASLVTNMVIENSPSPEAVTQLAASPTAIHAMPEIPVSPAKGQSTLAGNNGSYRWVGGILLLISILLGFVGYVLRKRLR
jgi:anti-sigma factor RsiW